MPLREREEEGGSPRVEGPASRESRKTLGESKVTLYASSGCIRFIRDIHHKALNFTRESSRQMQTKRWKRQRHAGRTTRRILAPNPGPREPRISNLTLILSFV